MHGAAVTVKPLTGEVNNNDHLVKIKCSSRETFGPGVDAIRHPNTVADQEPSLTAPALPDGSDPCHMFPCQQNVTK